MNTQEIQGLKLTDIAKEFGTPLYVYDAEKIKYQKEWFEKAFSGVDLKIKYAVKALSNINILKLMNKIGTGIDTVSVPEIQLALAAGFEPSQIAFTPSIIDFESIKKAVDYGVAINIDNLSNLEKFGSEYGNNVPCCIRLNPNILFEVEEEEKKGISRDSINKEHYSDIDKERVSVWHNQSKFGISLAQFDELTHLIKKYSIFIKGLHIHASHVIMDSKMFLKNAEVMFKLSQHFKDLEYFDFGGGIMVPHKEDDVVLDIDDIGQRFSALYKEFCYQKGKDFEIWFEPGRFLVSEAGFLLTTVDVLKSNKVINFAGVDTGFHHLIRPMMYDAYHEIENLSNPDGELEKYTVVGSLCEIDNLATDRMLNKIREKDILSVKNAGAYGYSMSSNYNSNYRPAEVLIINGEAILIRRRENYDDIIKNQIELDL